jgi:hypothetical protein
MDFLYHLLILSALAAILNGLALILWVVRGLILDRRNERLARRALEISEKILEKIPEDQRLEKATGLLRDVARFVEAQHAKPRWPKLPRTTPAPP